MKRTEIAQVSPFLMNGYLIISLDKKWVEVCEGIPTFAAIIDENGRLNLLGPIVSKKGVKST